MGLGVLFLVSACGTYKTYKREKKEEIEIPEVWDLVKACAQSPCDIIALEVAPRSSWALALTTLDEGVRAVAFDVVLEGGRQLVFEATRAALSSDGSKLALVDPVDFEPGLYVVDLTQSSSVPVRLSDTPANAHVAFDQAGERIMVVDDVEGGRSLVEVSIADGARLVWNSLEEGVPVTWGPSGVLVATSKRLLVVSQAGSAPLMITEAESIEVVRTVPGMDDVLVKVDGRNMLYLDGELQSAFHLYGLYYAEDKWGVLKATRVDATSPDEERATMWGLSLLRFERGIVRVQLAEDGLHIEAKYDE